MHLPVRSVINRNVPFLGAGMCWISNGTALLLVLGLPVALILVFNCVALSVTLVSIWKIQKVQHLYLCIFVEDSCENMDFYLLTFLSYIFTHSHFTNDVSKSILTVLILSRYNKFVGNQPLPIIGSFVFYSIKCVNFSN